MTAALGTRQQIVTAQICHPPGGSAARRQGFYRVAYTVGFRPWERAGQEAAQQLDSLLDRETSQRPTPPGRAVDLGCGTGAHSIKLANLGWQAIGIDNQPGPCGPPGHARAPAGPTSPSSGAT